VRVVACPSCGTANREGARFCDSCGATLAGASTLREVRKTVTVFFCDVSGSTALGERIDPESLRRVMARYFDMARTVLERHGGTVEKFIGDAVMAVFGVPTVHEDDALRALRAAVELRNTLAALNHELRRDYGVALLLRSGVNTGEVVTGTVERLATGDVVNVAARLEQAAPPGEILLGEQTLALARGAIEVEAVEPLPLKGKAAAVAAYRLLRVVEGAPAFDRRLDSPLVGRRGELARLCAAFAAAASERRCRLVTVLGPPGIGKSRLARELGAALANEAAVLVGSCLSYGEGITYWPLVEIFRAADAEEVLGAALAAGGSEDIFLAVRRALEQRARERPLALVLEDIHWAEPTLLDLLEHLVDWSRDAPILLLCLARPELLDERPAWGGQPQALTLRLEPLSGAESDELIDGLVDAARLREDVRARIRDTAEGNPLFVEQLLAALSEGGETGNLPPTIHALLAARLDGLPEEERDALERASVVGLEFEWEALAVLAADRRRPPGAWLATLVRKELILPHQVIEDTFRFRHILIRDAAYERIPKALRSQLHERFADWLDPRGPEFEEIVGYHLEQAYRSVEALGPAGERGRALAGRAAERLAASGFRAGARGDTRAAASLLERAAALFPVADPRRLSLLVGLGRTLRDEGRLDEADAVLTEAVELARAGAQRAVAADAELALTELRFHRTSETGVGRAQMVRAIESAIRVFEELDDEGGLGRALGLSAKLHLWKGESAAGLDEFERSALYARRAGDRAQEVESLRYVLISMLRGPTPIDEALLRCNELGEVGPTNVRFRIGLLTVRAQLEAWSGRFDIARALIGDARLLADELGGSLLVDLRVRPHAGEVELVAGDGPAAVRELRAACEAFQRVEELGYLASIAPHLGDALLASGADDEAADAMERWRADRLTVPEDADAQVGWRRVRAKALARRGEVEEAERLARDAVAAVSGTDCLPLHASALADLGEVLGLAGKPAEATAAREEAVRLYRRKGDVASADALTAGAGAPPLPASPRSP
jgi:class 3 adenylate cyclase/tetratricopeptide (TPR) repeat protein